MVQPPSAFRVQGWALALLLAFSASGCIGIADGPDLGPGSAAGLEGAESDSGVDAGDVPDAGDPDLCTGVACGHGTCESGSGSPACHCDPGFHPDALSCVADPPVDLCLGITCGTKAHCTAGSCGCDTGYEGNAAVGCTPIPGVQETTTRAQLVSIARAELGNCEGSVSRPYMLGQPGLWCYDFVAWVYSQATYSLPTPLSLPTVRIGSLPAGWRPKAGDLIKYTYQHYGMVESVSADGLTVTTLEGNVGGCVTERSTTDASLEYYGNLATSF